MSRITTAARIFGFSAPGVFALLALAALPGRSAADQVILATGETLKGDVSGIFGDTLVLEHPSLGKVEIPFADIKDLNIDPASGDTALPPAEPEKAGEDAAAPAPPARDSKFEVGANGSQGNSETFDLRSAFMTEHKTREARIKLDACYFYGSKIDLVSRNDYTVGIINDWYLPRTRWSVFAQGRWDWDAFKEWQARVNASAGAGYRVLDARNADLTFRVGAGYFREYGSENEESRPEGLAGFEFNWAVAPGQKVYADTVCYPEFTGNGYYRVVSSAYWKARLGMADGLAVSIGAKNENKWDVEPGFERNDFKYYGSVIIEF